jgi:hypothetical protein
MVHELDRKRSPLNSGYIARKHAALAYAGRKYFGGWEETLTAAGFDYSRIRRKNFWNRQNVVARIQELHKANEPLYVSAAEVKYGGLVGAATVYIGSWRKAIKAAGLDYSKVKRQQEWSRPMIVKEIRRMHREGVPLRTTIPIRAKYRVLHAAAVRYYGSWAVAMKAAGLGKVLSE